MDHLNRRGGHTVAMRTRSMLLELAVLMCTVMGLCRRWLLHQHQRRHSMVVTRTDPLPPLPLPLPHMQQADWLMLKSRKPSTISNSVHRPLEALQLLMMIRGPRLMMGIGRTLTRLLSIRLRTLLLTEPLVHITAALRHRCAYTTSASRSTHTNRIIHTLMQPHTQQLNMSKCLHQCLWCPVDHILLLLHQPSAFQLPPFRLQALHLNSSVWLQLSPMRLHFNPLWLRR